jgi:PP-loop superfamily ATP-utilizing enzyme
MIINYKKIEKQTIARIAKTEELHTPKTVSSSVGADRFPSVNQNHQAEVAQIHKETVIQQHEQERSWNRRFSDFTLHSSS